MTRSTSDDSVYGDDVPLRITPHTRTPCCSRVPAYVKDHRYVCRGCGVVYVDQAAPLRAAFPGAIDVTSMTPRRLLGATATDDDNNERGTDGVVS